MAGKKYFTRFKLKNVLARPSILFFPVNGSGLGHLTRCLAYAKRLPRNYKISFFSLSPAIEAIEQMGFKADYFISPFWSDNSKEDWNAELALRLGLLLEEIRPSLLVFDGTWPFNGMRQACRNYQLPLKLVWSKRGLLKEQSKDITVHESFFDLVICPGELGSQIIVKENRPARHVHINVPPVCIADEQEFLDKTTAREKLNLPSDKKLALFSLGPGNLKNVDKISSMLLDCFHQKDFIPVILKSPISVADMELPDFVMIRELYPAAKYLRAFDCVISAAGYNTCCEIASAGIPAIIIPNELVADDQQKRARILQNYAPVSICNGLYRGDIESAINNIYAIIEEQRTKFNVSLPNGAYAAAKAMEKLVERSSEFADTL